MSKFGKGASFFRVRQGLQSLNPALKQVTVIVDVTVFTPTALQQAIGLRDFASWKSPQLTRSRRKSHSEIKYEIRPK